MALLTMCLGTVTEPDGEGSCVEVHPPLPVLVVLPTLAGDGRGEVLLG